MQYPSGLIPFSSHIIVFIVLICYFDCIVIFLAYLGLSLREIFIPSIFNPGHFILRKPEGRNVYFKKSFGHGRSSLFTLSTKTIYIYIGWEVESGQLIALQIRIASLLSSR